jgi:hypothetical protein
MTITAADLAGNSLLALSPEKTSINPASELTRDANGVMQGSGGADNLHYILVRPFKVTCTPPSVTIKKGEKGTHTISIQNLDPDNERSFNIQITYKALGWSVNPESENDFSVTKGGSKSWTFYVTNSDAVDAIDLDISVTETESNCTKHPGTLDNPDQPAHIEDHPDDNQSVSSPNYPTPWLYDSKSPIGVLSSGWGEGLNYLLGKFKIATALVKPDLTILNESGRSINDLDVLCIGSAGLEELESSLLFRKKLADFVSQGGRLMVLTAKNGSEWNALPGGEVSGYGWSEDMSCFNSAVYIANYHQVLCSQQNAYLDANIDGYFTKWPDSAKVLLRRNKNGMPAMITYSLGKGIVITSSLYSDWAYGNNQASEQEENIGVVT